MARRSSLFAQFDLDYADHPKIIGLSDAAFRAHIEMILYARKHLTDGRIPKRFAAPWETRSVTDSVTEGDGVGYGSVLDELLSNDPDAPSLTRLPNGDYQLHDFADWQQTRAEVEKKLAVNRANGAKGGRPPKHPRTGPITQSVSESGTESAPQKRTEPVTGSKPEKEEEEEEEVTTPPTPQGELLATPEPSKPKGYSAEFETAWKAFPQYGRKGKPKAFDAYEKARRRASPAVILAGIEQYAEFVEKTDVKCKYMQGWLNDDRWEDENVVQPYRNGFNRPTAEENVRAAYDVAQFYAQQEQQEVSAGLNRRLSA